MKFQVTAIIKIRWLNWFSQKNAPIWMAAMHRLLHLTEKWMNVCVSAPWFAIVLKTNKGSDLKLTTNVLLPLLLCFVREWSYHLLSPLKIGNFGNEAQHSWVDSVLASLFLACDFGPFIWVNFEDAPVRRRIFL